MAVYDKFAKKYSDSMGEKGDYFHKKYIDPAVYEIVGNPKDKIIYDIGCGNGYMARNFTKRGATVYASDASPELINIAKKKSKGLDIYYRLNDATDFRKYKARGFDVVVMNMAIHYISNLDKLLNGISRVLKVDGIFAFSTNHFLRPEYPYSSFVKGDLYGKEKLFVKVTNYLKTYKAKVKSYWDKQTDLEIIYRPLSLFVNTMSENNLYLFRIIEPESIEFGRNFSEKLRKSHHIPTFLIVGAKKI